MRTPVAFRLFSILSQCLYLSPRVAGRGAKVCISSRRVHAFPCAHTFPDKSTSLSYRVSYLLSSVTRNKVRKGVSIQAHIENSVHYSRNAG